MKLSTNITACATDQFSTSVNSRTAAWQRANNSLATRSTKGHLKLKADLAEHHVAVFVDTITDGRLRVTGWWVVTSGAFVQVGTLTGIFSLVTSYTGLKFCRFRETENLEHLPFLKNSIWQKMSLWCLYVLAEVPKKGCIRSPHPVPLFRWRHQQVTNCENTQQ